MLIFISEIEYKIPNVENRRIGLCGVKVSDVALCEGEHRGAFSRVAHSPQPFALARSCQVWQRMIVQGSRCA